MTGDKPLILCVDDRTENLKVRILLLETFGCAAMAASNKAEALELFSENEIDLLLLDYHLANNETGDEIAREVRAKSPAVPIILLSGDSKIPEDARVNVDEVLVKGATNPRILLDVIQKLLPAAKMKPRRSMLVRPPDSKRVS